MFHCCANQCSWCRPKQLQSTEPCIDRCRSPSEARDKGPAQRRSAKRSSRATSSSGSETDDDDDVSIEASSPGPSEVSDDEPSAVEDAAPPDEEPVLDDFARPANPPVVIVGEHSNGER